MKDSRDVKKGQGKNAYSDRWPIPVDEEAKREHSLLKDACQELFLKTL